jgi:preprotein translocase subunit YajC
MEILRAFLYSLAVFAGLAVIALLVAGMMMFMYFIIHRSEKKSGSGAEAKSAAAGTAGKVG